MRAYLDTALLVSALTAEADGQRVGDWVQARASDDLLVSDWVIAEFSAALSRKLRVGQIDAIGRAAALAAFSQFCTNNAVVLSVERPQFRTAAAFADRHVAGIRAGDALHLAIAFDNRATLCTLDRRLAEAGPALGVMTLLV
ncbi:MAG: type II toxin-antitoxin system VapC family toxin [Alphaproteobacteria bacterium]|nr:type II toxin-antitoxin system VapC family toxin [Alphaproteobacteria bacterium]